MIFFGVLDDSVIEGIGLMKFAKILSLNNSRLYGNHTVGAPVLGYGAA